MSVALAALCAGLAAWLAWSPRDADRRLRRASARVAQPPGLAGCRDPVAPRPAAGLRLVAAVVAGVGAALTLGGGAGLAAGVLAAAGLHRWLATLEPRERRRRRERLAAELPVVADLLAACLAAGSPLDDAVDAVATAVGGPMREVLRVAVATSRLGGSPAACWAALGEDPALAPLGRALARAGESGAPVADVVARLAEEQRSTRRWEAEAAARQVGVRAVAPLGLCFLPAFVLLGILPVVAGLAADVLGPLR